MKHAFVISSSTVLFSVLQVEEGIRQQEQKGRKSRKNRRSSFTQNELLQSYTFLLYCDKIMLP